MRKPGRTPMWRRHDRVHGADPARDVDDEFAFHLEKRIEALVATGLSLEEARAQALAKFGDLERGRRACIVPAVRATRTAPAVILRAD